MRYFLAVNGWLRASDEAESLDEFKIKIQDLTKGYSDIVYSELTIEEYREEERKFNQLMKGNDG